MWILFLVTILSYILVLTNDVDLTLSVILKTKMYIIIIMSLWKFRLCKNAAVPLYCFMSIDYYSNLYIFNVPFLAVML